MYIYVYIHILIWSLYKKYYHSKQLRLFDHTTLATFLFWFVFEWSKSRVGRFPPLNYAAWQENSGLHNHLVEWRFDEACHNPQESVISDLYTLRIGVINWHLTGSLRHKMNFKWCDLYILGCIDMHVYNIISVLIYNFQTLLMSCVTSGFNEECNSWDEPAHDIGRRIQDNGTFHWLGLHLIFFHVISRAMDDKVLHILLSKWANLL